MRCLLSHVIVEFPNSRHHFFLSFSCLTRRGHFFRLNHARKFRKRCSHPRFSFQAKILGIFWLKCRLVFFGCYGWPWLFSLSQAMTRGKRSVKRKERQNSDRTRTIASSPVSPPLPSPPPSYSKASLGITHTESLFADYDNVLLHFHQKNVLINAAFLYLAFHWVLSYFFVRARYLLTLKWSLWMYVLPLKLEDNLKCSIWIVEHFHSMLRIRHQLASFKLLKFIIPWTVFWNASEVDLVNQFCGCIIWQKKSLRVVAGGQISVLRNLSETIRIPSIAVRSTNYVFLLIKASMLQARYILSSGS